MLLLELLLDHSLQQGCIGPADNTNQLLALPATTKHAVNAKSTRAESAAYSIKEVAGLGCAAISAQ